MNIDVDRARSELTYYLTRHYGIRNVNDFICMFEELLALYDQMGDDLDMTQIITDVCTNLKGEIGSSEQPILLLRLMEICSKASGFDANDPIYRQVAACFEVSGETMAELRHYVLGEESEMVRIQRFDGLDGSIKTLLMLPYNLVVFSYHGNDLLQMNDVPLAAGLFRVWEQSSIVKCPHRAPLYYSNIIEAYGYANTGQHVEFCGRDLNYRYPHSDNGLHDFSFDLRSGELLAIMGGSGAGKTTLLKLLNGSLQPQSGSITINGHDLSESASRSLIGYVPQDDLLVEELSVYQNLWYVARLSFYGIDDESLRQKVLSVLRNLDLENVKDLKVGSALDKYISGGQRKRLNIALELIREPAVLFLDEPTSGLSSSDTERVILLLKKQTSLGKLIIVNIHQPSSDVYKLFDRLWLLDRGGYPVFDGNPIEAITYFKTAANYADADTSMCPVCGNVNPEVVLNIIDEKALTRSGQESDQRKVQPQEWNRMYMDRRPAFTTVRKHDVPHSDQRHPSAFRQFLIQLQRSVHTKWHNRQWLLIALLEAPLLACVCAWLTRYAPESGYTLLDNKNLVTFIFMSVIVAIFVGMSGSAEEIIRDRAMLQREKYLQLSYPAYISSKIALQAFVSMLQTLLFAGVGLSLLQFSDVFWQWWLVLLAVALVANLTGLLLSQCLSSVVAIYITIPLFLIPQILLCGVVIDFKDLDAQSTTGNVPVIGNVIPSRWAYEALAVTSFVGNDYEKNFFELDQQKNELHYYRTVHLYELQSQLQTLEHERSKGLTSETDRMQVIRLGLPAISQVAGLVPYAGSWTYPSLKAYMDQAYDSLSTSGNRLTLRADRQLSQLRRAMGPEAFHAFRSRHCNMRLEETVCNMGHGTTHDIVAGHIVPRVWPVYLTPRSSWGGAPFYSHIKCIGQTHIPTLWFNLGVLLLMALGCALLIYTDFPGRYVRKEHR